MAASKPRRRSPGQPSPTPTKGATGDRADTEALIENAALELLERNGVLAGLNLREVADLAKVNRGLVYLYFGSRQALLRSALSKRAAAVPIWNSARRTEQSLPTRAEHDVLELAAVDDQVRLHALLHLDGTPGLIGMPYLSTALELLARDRDQGAIPSDTDLEALHVLLVSLGAGYSLYRESFASEIGSSATELDERVARVLRMLLEEVGTEAGTS
jgi:AcrR family transcriptional regulator